MFNYVTTIFIFFEDLPLLAVIIVLPFAFAETFPVLETVATLVLELFHVTVPVPEVSVPRERVLPLGRLMVM